MPNGTPDTKKTNLGEHPDIYRTLVAAETTVLETVNHQQLAKDQQTCHQRTGGRYQPVGKNVVGQFGDFDKCSLKLMHQG